ncbi:MAG: hypothetical protein EA424_08380 [Planctomycetaceae bacterium]|nr:MAG: hypothetical protein EA424_08380 [Planctomycetaceae bacterium]
MYAKIKPSRLLKPPTTDKSNPKKKRPGSAKRKKTKDLKIDETVPLYLEDLPAGTRLEGYRDFVVQGEKRKGQASFAWNLERRELP